MKAGEKAKIICGKIVIPCTIVSVGEDGLTATIKPEGREGLWIFGVSKRPLKQNTTNNITK